MIITSSISVISLVVLFFQDFRSRSIHWSPLIILFIALVVEALFAQGIAEVSGMVLRNNAFLAIQGVILTFYYLVKGRPISSIINVSIGSGDLLLFLITTFCFSILNFVFFYIFTLITSLVVWLLVNRIFSLHENSVPLAGLTSAVLIITIVVDRCSHSFNRFDDSLITSFLCRIVT
ncbi:MAG: hypothetical protein RBS37_00265 [Bacteroidales bacterium]|nr:hypothetical protein [Bacteroidales bacterium]